MGGKCINFQRMKILKNLPGIKEVRLECGTDASAIEYVSLRLKLDGADFQHKFTCQLQDDCADTEAKCQLLLRRAYSCYYMLSALHLEQLPEQSSWTWTSDTIVDLLKTATSRFSNCSSIFDEHPVMTIWEDLQIILDGKAAFHPWRKAYLRSTPASKTPSGNIHFDFLIPDYAISSMSTSISTSSSSSPVLFREPPSLSALRGRCMDRAASALRGSRNTYEEADPDVLARCKHFLLGGDGRPSLENLVLSIIGKEHAQKMCLEAGVPHEQQDATIFLGYICAMLLLVDIEMHTAATEDHDMLDALLLDPTADPQDAFNNQASPMMKVFLLTFSSTRARRCHDGSGGGLFRHIDRTTDKDKNSRALSLLSALASLVGSNQCDRGDLSMCTSFQQFIAVILILDRGGTSDRTLKDLSDWNVCTRPNQAREAIRKAGAVLNLQFVFPNHKVEEETVVQTLAFSSDNADIHMFGKVWNFLACCAIYLGFVLTAAQVLAVRTGLRLGAGAMPMPSLASCSEIILNEEDDVILRDECFLYNIPALLLAHFNMTTDKGAERPPEVAMDDEMPIEVNDNVYFMYIGRRTDATVTSISGDTCTLAFVQGNGDEESYVARTVTVRRQSDEDARPSGTRALANDTDYEEQTTKSSFGFRYPASLLWAFDVICSVSSKHNRATAQLVASVVAAAGSTYILVIGVDQEFYVPLALMFFITGLPIIPVLSFGHLLKCAASSILVYYEQLLFVDSLRALGYTPDTPAYRKIIDGKHISKTLRIMVMMAHAHRVALADRYLRERGDFLLGDSSVRDMFLSFEGDIPQERILLDEQGRPTVLHVCDGQLAVARDFYDWAYGSVGGPRDDAAMPMSGAFSPSVPDDLVFISRLALNSKGAVKGVRELCEEAGIELPTHTTRALACQRYFAFKSAGGGDIGVAAAATIIEESCQTLPHLPAGAKVNEKALVDFLFRVMPPFLLLMKLTKVRTHDILDTIQKRMELRGCIKCTGRFDTCRCSSRHHWLVAMKGMLVSVFMRRQPNYQRSIILFLCFVVAVLWHPSTLFVRLVLGILEACLALSISGNSLLGQPLDLLQETAVGQVKRAVSRKPSAFAQAILRAKLYSFFLFQRMRSRAQAFQSDSSELKYQKQRSDAEVSAEMRDYITVSRVSRVVIDSVIASGSSNRIAGNPSFEISNAQRVFYLWSLAKNSAAAAVRAVAEGLKERVSVSLPTPNEAAQTCMHVVCRKPKSREADKDFKELERLRKLASIRSMTDRGVLEIPDSFTMFASTGAAGDQKAELGILMLTRYGAEDCVVGDDRRRPFLLFKTVHEKSDFMAEQRENAHTQVTSSRSRVKLVDFPLFLQNQPQPWKLGVPDNIEELARSIIKYGISFFENGVTFVILCVDYNLQITWLREIQRQKRGKVQKGEAMESAIHGQRGSRETLDNLGGYHALMSSKDGGLARVFAEVSFQLKNPCVDEGWNAGHLLAGHTSIDGCAVAFVGGQSGGNCVLVSTNGVRLAPSALPLYCSSLYSALVGIENQGEGEAMIFLAARRIVHLLASQPDGAHAASTLAFELVCFDVDALGGRAMPDMHRLLQLYQDLEISVANVRVYLTLHSKRPTLLRQLGLLVQSRNGSRSQARADGRELIAVADLLALYDAIENDASASGGGSTKDCQAVGATTALLALLSNDMLAPMGGGMSASHIYESFYSDEFIGLAQTFGPLVVLHKQDGLFDEFKLSLVSLQMLFYVALKNRRSTIRQILLRYTKEQAYSKSKPIPFSTVAACALVAHEAVPVPSASALLCRLSCAISVFNQHANFLTKDAPRPASMDAELQGTSFVCEDDGRVRPKYTVTSANVKRTDLILSCLRKQFGDMVDIDIVHPDYPFSPPQAELVKCFKNKGLTSVSVPASLVFRDGVVKTQEELVKFVDSKDEFNECGTNHLVFHAVVESTLVHHTDFNPRGMGRPLLLSAKIKDVVTNKGKWNSPWHSHHEDEDVNPITVFEDESDAHLKDCLAVINAGSGDAAFATTQDLLTRVIWVVVTRSLTEVQEANHEEFDVNEAGEDDSLDEEVERNDDDSINLCDDDEIEEHEGENEVEDEDDFFGENGE